MIAAGTAWGDNPRFDLSRLSFGSAADRGGTVERETLGRGVAVWRDTPRLGGGTIAKSRDGALTLFHGWLDNAAELARRLGLPSGSDAATIHAHASAEWGLAAERELIGDYAAIALLPDGSLRLSRAPWSQHGLFYTVAEGCAVAASIPRAIFELGLPRTVDAARYAEMLYGLAETWGAATWYEGLSQVEQGSVVTIREGRVAVERWYDPHALSPTRLKHDDDYVEAAQALLADAVTSALRPATKPGILLSGGLDSPLVAAELLHQLPPGQKLKSFTFEPLPGENEPVLPGQFHSDRPAVEAFAAMHPALDPQFVDGRGVAFGSLLDDTFRLSDAAYPGFALTEFHGTWQAASDAGCDWVFTADFGNQTFSNDGRWAYVEFLRQGRFGELLAMLRHAPGDDRPLWRKLAARSILPNLPAVLRGAVRTLLHGEVQRPLVRREMRERLDLDARSRLHYGEREWHRTRREFITSTWAWTSAGTEVVTAIEELYGFRMRTIPQYRPLIEFCLTIPTDQFVRGGEQRWLARRMARGRLPEQQRLNRDYGRHGVDWHRRQTPLLPVMREELERIADDPVMSEVIDVDRAIDLLDRWPDTPSYRAKLEIFMPAAAAIVAARFARHVDGRN